MSTNFTYIKGVRTRYRNILEKEIQYGREIFGCDLSKINIEEQIVSTNKCIEKIKSYSDKVMNQCNTFASAIGDSDAPLTEQILEEDCELCDNAMECNIDLKQHKQTLISLKEKRELKSVKDERSEETDPNQIIQLQRDMQQLLAYQMKQQQESIERQDNKRESSSSVKLPKLDMVSFNGDKTRWIEFWDSFQCTVHINKNLSDVEKFNYLKSKVNGEAKIAISGLALSNENYKVAVEILKKRFGNVQEVVDLHYNQIINLQPATNKTSSLRSLLDNVERHLRSLEVLEQNINQDVFVSMVRSKLPEDVLIQLEIQNGASNKWTIFSLRDRLHEYIVARERATKETGKVSNDRNDSTSSNHAVSKSERFKKSLPGSHRISPSTSSVHALTANNKQFPVKTSVFNYRDKCRYCTKQHWSDECPEYRTINARKERIKGSCFKCLKEGHFSTDCRRSKACVHCGEVNEHHRSLCPKKFKVRESMTHLSSEISEMSEQTAENVLVSSNELVLMQTALTEVENPVNSEKQSVRLLLDSGSQRTYITQDLAKRLRLKSESEQELKLVTFGSEKPQTLKTKSTKVNIKLNNGKNITITANIVPVISGAIHRKPVGVLSSEHVQHLVGSVHLADTLPTESESSTIELLIGNDYYLDLILGNKIEVQPGLYLLGSKFGWILTGRASEVDEDANDTNMLILTHGNSLTRSDVFSKLDPTIVSKPDLEDFWNVEAIGIIDKHIKSDDETAMDNFKDTVKFEDGRYQVTWPWKTQHPQLPENRELALGRLRSCVNRMKNKPELMQKYDNVIQDQIQKGIVEKVDSTTNDGIKHYIPHHAVITPQKTTTKLRIVYDASAKSRKENNSLNECLYRGPVMLHDLCGMLMRFRMHKTAVVADIEKAFLQIGLQIEQRDVTRFLWLKNSETTSVNNANVQEYRFCRVPFGVIASPFVLGATIEHHLESYHTSLAEKLKDDIYVDNLITGANTPFEAIELYSGAKTMFKEASMNLREWISNDITVNEYIPTEDRADCESLKVLGHQWDINNDTMSLKSVNVSKDLSNTTKRSVLKEVASVFDPLGLFSPILLRGKVLLQELWSKGIDWDDNLCDEDKLKWSPVLLDFQKVSKCQVPRCVTKANDMDGTYELLCFCDASGKAYSAAIYLRETVKGVSNVELVFSKTRLAPIKGMTIPRLELMAVVIGVRSIRFVQNELKQPIHHVYLWTDSQCVLRWISSNKDLSVFVRNRVNEIKSHINITFRCIPTSENPADVATRGTDVVKLSKYALWWHGPVWLCQPVNVWPTFEFKTSTPSEHNYESELRKKKEESKSQISSVLEICDGANEVSHNKSDCSVPFGMDSDKFSTVTKLIRVTAFAHRFIRKLKKCDHSESGALTASELQDAEHMWLRHVQNKIYPEVFGSIHSNKPNNLQRQLGLFIDDQGLLRCRGRLEHSDLSEGARCPILLPKKERFTHLLIEKNHKELLHSGASHTLSHLRQKYWIPQGRAIVRSVVQRCHICRRHEGGPYRMPPMPPLPKCRVTESTPFEHTGLDYLGPLHIRSFDGTKKVWVCLFTCLVTRAIHLELIQDMSAEEFLFGFRRFISQRGTPCDIISDNASQFKTASEVLGSVWNKVLKDEDVQSYVSDSGIKWRFIVQLAPWMGGYYERLIGLVKRSLRKSLGRRLLTLIQMQTILKEVEAVINSRPLVYVSDDVDSNIALTPGHFLSLNPNIGIPESTHEDNDGDYLPYGNTASRLLQIWRKGQKLLSTFWKIWRDEYLLSLRERTQTNLKSTRIQATTSPQIDDVVLVKDELSRGCWRFGRIIDLVKSRDGEVRSVKVQLPSSRVIGRPLNLLYPIEVSKQSDSTENSDSTDSLVMKKDNQREKRCAAKIAERKIKEIYKNTNIM